MPPKTKKSNSKDEKGRGSYRCGKVRPFFLNWMSPVGVGGNSNSWRLYANTAIALVYFFQFSMENSVEFPKRVIFVPINPNSNEDRMNQHRKLKMPQRKLKWMNFLYCDDSILKFKGIQKVTLPNPKIMWGPKPCIHMR